jgi:HAD superfamily hydrolase (TIGR01509 family)
VKALLFDCDGVLVDTERDGHRVAFNQAFADRGLDIVWDVETYGRLLRIAGGKERMRHYFDEAGWPTGIGDPDAFIRDLHALKTDRFVEIIESGRLTLRSGVRRLVDEAIDAGIALAVCSTSNKHAVTTIVEKLLGSARRASFSAILAGDVVSKKKPDPEIYDLAKDRLGLPGHDCVVVEDSRNGLLAAKGAGMRCLVTISAYTQDEDFSEAEMVVRELGDPPGDAIRLSDLRALTDWVSPR